MLSHWLTAGLLLAGSPIAAEPQRLDVEVGVAKPVDRTTTTDEIALGTDHADRMTVPVSVAGQGPYQFLVDTGSERTVISRELARQLRLSSGRSAILHSVMGANNIDTVHIPQLQVSSNTLSVVDAPALGAANIGADGMLGIDSLRSQRVLFDFKAKTMSITPSNQPLERLEGDTIVVRARSRDGRLIFTQAKIDGRRVSVIVDTGSQVRVRGEGHAAPAPGQRGDLIVITRVHPHPVFTRKGDHLHCEVPLTVPEAALGARIQIPAPDGPVMVTIPAGTQAGQTLRVRGKGCPRLDREGRGDLLVQTRVVIPRNADPALEEVLQALRRLLPDNPRAELWPAAARREARPGGGQ